MDAQGNQLCMHNAASPRQPVEQQKTPTANCQRTLNMPMRSRGIKQSADRRSYLARCLDDHWDRQVHVVGVNQADGQASEACSA